MSRSSRGVTIGALVALTALHVAYRHHVDAARPVAKVSTLTVGTSVSNLDVLSATDSTWGPGQLLLPSEECQLVVAFDPECPHCVDAADKERQVPAADRLPTTWVAPGDSASAWRFEDMVGEGTRITRSDDAWSMLKVFGVPAAFLVDGQGTIRRVWPYHGDETREDLTPECKAD